MYKTNTEKDSRQDMLTKLFTAEIKRQDEEALKALLRSKSGRWFLMRLIDQSQVHSPCFTGNSTTFYNLGRRAVGLDILSAITAMGLNAIKLKQKAELEYVQTQVKARQLATEYLEEGEQNG